MWSSAPGRRSGSSPRVCAKLREAGLLTSEMDTNNSLGSWR